MVILRNPYARGSQIQGDCDTFRRISARLRHKKNESRSLSTNVLQLVFYLHLELLNVCGLSHRIQAALMLFTTKQKDELVILVYRPAVPFGRVLFAVQKFRI